MRIAAVTVLMLLAACGDTGGQQSDDPVITSPPAGSERVPEEGDTIRGTLGGDGELEGGCAWIQDGATRWEVQYPEGYEISFDPLTLTGPEGQTAGEGDTLTVTGSEGQDMVTICQVGPVWIASSVTFD